MRMLAGLVVSKGTRRGGSRTVQMGKKSTAGSGKALGKTTQEVANNGLTGIFHVDFVELLERQKLPRVEVRNLRKNETETESHSAHEEDQTLENRFVVFVDYDDAEDPSTLKSIQLRNWLLSDVVLSAIAEALTLCSYLTSINVWNVGLTEHTLHRLTQLVIQQNVKQVVIDGNALISASSVVDLLQPKSSVEHLSMKCCGISDNFLAELSPHLSENKCLVHLNLSCNRIGDVGVSSLATSLRLNRTLLSLALTNNYVGDIGALSLARVLSRFELNHSEVVLRRRLLSLLERSEDGVSSADLEKTKDPGIHRSPSISSVDAKAKTAASKDKGQPSKGASKKTDAKKEEKGKKDDKAKKGTDSKKNKGKDSKASKKGADPPVESPKPDPVETINPLLDVSVEKEQDKLFIPGNTTLAFLTLAFNRIGDDGIHAFLEAIKMQETYSHLGSGLLQLSLQNNVALDRTPDMIEINELLFARKSRFQGE